jgi:predicted N-formylglutamate amidohydrolase
MFRGQRRLLESHRGHDRGALAMARSIARSLHARLVVATVSRLLVELNRSPGRQFRQSPIMRDAPADIRSEVCRRYYVPHWRAIEAFVRLAIERGERVVHIASHTFTPSLDGRTMRRCDVGLLYDPRRVGERTLCLRWQAALARCAPTWIVRRNYPYRGRSDGLTRYLRARYADASYCGIELEINQRHVLQHGAIDARQCAAIVTALQIALQDAGVDIRAAKMTTPPRTRGRARTAGLASISASGSR